jgi:tripartite-type tricarboxylate transporter receptor subunit TctC
MTRRTIVQRVAIWGAAAALTTSLAACGGNLGNDTESESADKFPSGPVSLYIGQDPGGSTDLIGRALAKVASDELGEPMPVENKPGANGAVAAQELAGKKADGQSIMVVNASLIAITPLAVSEDEAIDINDYEVVTGISQDDYVLVANAESGYKTVQDLADAGKSLKFATTGVGTGSQLSQELLFKQAELKGSAVPFDGGSPALTAVLGNQVDLASVQLGEAFPQIEAGKVTPIVTFSKERNTFLPDTPTAIEEGYDVPVAQYRAVIAPKGTPQATLDKLKKAFDAAFADPDYQAFNEQALLTPHEISGDEVTEEWTASRDSYKALIDQYGIDLGTAE